METPVYLFTGFLEAGKTKFITETLTDPNFNDGKRRILLVLCEEGVEEYDEDSLGSNVTVVTFDDEQTLTTDRLAAQQKRAKADIVVIEYNGMWQLDRFYQLLPEGWMVYQEILIVDSTTAMIYNANMRSLMVDKLTSAEMVVFNRVTPATDKMELHKLVRGISKRASICYEDLMGEIEFDNIEDPLPYDVNAPVITIEDRDFAIFYRDLCDDFGKYYGKTVRFKGTVAVDPEFSRGEFAIGRHVMTCCADDIAYRGVMARGMHGKKLVTRDWVIAEGKLVEEYSKIYDAKGPILVVTSLEMAEKPEQEVATFY